MSWLSTFLSAGGICLLAMLVVISIDSYHESWSDRILSLERKFEDELGRVRTELGHEKGKRQQAEHMLKFLMKTLQNENDSSKEFLQMPEGDIVDEPIEELDEKTSVMESCKWLIRKETSKVMKIVNANITREKKDLVENMNLLFSVLSTKVEESLQSRENSVLESRLSTVEDDVKKFSSDAERTCNKFKNDAENHINKEVSSVSENLKSLETKIRKSLDTVQEEVTGDLLNRINSFKEEMRTGLERAVQSPERCQVGRIQDHGYPNSPYPVRKNVRFETKFKDVPRVSYAVQEMDVSNKANVCFHADVEDVTSEGFNIHVHGCPKSKGSVYGVVINWIACP